MWQNHPTGLLQESREENELIKAKFGDVFETVVKPPESFTPGATAAAADTEMQGQNLGFTAAAPDLWHLRHSCRGCNSLR